MTERTAPASPRLTHRQRVLLALLRASGGRMGEGDFQRLLFDYGERCRERGAAAPYDFVAHGRSGPRSFTAIADRDRLVRRGVLVAGCWRLTEEGGQLAANLKDRDVAVFAARLSRPGTDAETGGNAEAALADDARPAAANDAGKPNGGLLATIGYEGRSYEAYFNALLGSGVSRLCDVRARPLSRKWGFSKRLLAQGCHRFGMRYEPFPELGIESERRAGLSGRAAYDRLFTRYEATTLRQGQDAVARIAGWIDSGERVALTCFEKDSRDCHRSRVARAVARTTAKPLMPRHL